MSADSSFSRTPTHTLGASVSLFPPPAGLDVQFHPLAIEESKEDASTTFAQDPLHSNRDSERQSLPQDSDKHAYMSQQSTQPPPTGRGAEEQKEMVEEVNDTDEGHRGEESKEVRLPSHHSEISEPPKVDHFTLARRPRTAEIPRNRLDDLIREEDLIESTSPARLFEEQKHSSPGSPQPMSLSPPPEPVPDILLPINQLNASEGDIEGSSDPTPPQPPPLGDDFYEFSHEEEVVPRSPRVVLFHNHMLVDELSEDESHPRPTDSVAVDQHEDVEPHDVPAVLAPHQPVEPSPPEAFHRQASSIDSPTIPSFNIDQIRAFPSSLDPSRVTYWESLTAFKGLEMPPPVRSRRCWQSLFQCCSTALPPAKRTDCDVLLALAERPVGSTEADKSLIFSLWSAHFPDEAYAEESLLWTDIGFTGSDIRGEASTLDLLQLLFLCTDRATTASTLLAFSRKRGATFRYAKVCAAVNQMAVKVVRSGRLDEIFAREKSIVNTFNDFFLGCVRSWFAEFQRTPGRVDWTALEAKVRRRPREVLRKCTLGS